MGGRQEELLRTKDDKSKRVNRDKKSDKKTDKKSDKKFKSKRKEQTKDTQVRMLRFIYKEARAMLSVDYIPGDEKEEEEEENNESHELEEHSLPLGKISKLTKISAKFAGGGGFFFEKNQNFFSSKNDKNGVELSKTPRKRFRPF